MIQASRLIVILCAFAVFQSCKKEWEQPDLYTANLSLANAPDSVDANHVYYYADGMKLQIHLLLNSNGNTIRDENWTDMQNLHWTDTIESVKVQGSVVNLSNDTSLHIENYPLIMRVFKNSEVLYEEAKVDNSYSF